jgi:hypothetical protein
MATVGLCIKKEVLRYNVNFIFLCVGRRWLLKQPEHLAVDVKIQFNVLFVGFIRQ